ncbi:MAG: glycoside hydrolase family 26 protein [Bacteroidia bacterium]
MKKTILIFCCAFFGINISLRSQLKFIIDDFEGFADGASHLEMNGVFTFGSCKAYIESDETIQRPGIQPDYLEKRCISIKMEGNENYAGWGKGIGLNLELEPDNDFFNFYVEQSAQGGSTNVKIQLQEDDNSDGKFDKQFDDAWECSYTIKNVPVPGWQLISVPLSKFKDDDFGGDGIFNCNYKEGRLLCLVISFTDTLQTKANKILSFDFLCFSKGPLSEKSDVSNKEKDLCSLGFWSKEGNVGNFTEIGNSFNELFKPAAGKKLGVIHFFQPFSTGDKGKQVNYPSPERINKIIDQGYIPMITLENHFVNAGSKIKQPNLYTIVEGHMDDFFRNWAGEIKKIKGTVLIRILHEFNGDWYPWCVSNNDKNPHLFIEAFRHICTVFKNEDVRNARFIWCPNSMSVPQEKWNYIMDAYPGDGYVDLIGMDIYNGAGQKSSVWRSFKKEGIENYFYITQFIPDKPVIVCETASREREAKELKPAQTKDEWIMQMSSALKTDMHKIRLLTWFNEKSTFRINSSAESSNAFLKYIMLDDYFRSGCEYFRPYMEK